ncbi:hypothetical protein RMCBS344292_12794 [Rhizopus microsporus]|nr:hypothetical protein RMCBS344292_12794 [Rhizopus microsporus]
MWHTKRMKMVNMWGYRIASKPNTKSARTVYKSFTRLCIAHDASYMACIELRGEFNEICKAMSSITDLALPSVASERYIKGTRIGHSNLYEHLGYPSNLICPITFLWKPSRDVLWIWIHPSAYQEAIHFIEKSINEQNLTVQLIDLRQEILRFELVGPRSTALLQAILDPVTKEGCKGNELWKDLHSLRSSSSLSPGCVIGLLVNDPRLKFPQKVPPRTNEMSDQDRKRTQSVIAHWPEHAADSDIWNAELRKTLMEKKIAEYGLNLRRQQNLVPGTKLEPTPEDSQIPLLLFQRGTPVCQKTGVITNQPLTSSELTEGWTLILPRGWGMAFWKSLVFAGARVAGFEDMHAMHFESGIPYFPYDFPGTRAFEVQRQVTKREAEDKWSKKPPAKRVSFVKRGIDYPFECAFESLSCRDYMAIDQDGPLTARPVYSLLQGASLVTAALSNNDQLNEVLRKLVANRKLDVSIPELMPDEMLLKIRLKYIDRGKPAPNAMVYLVEDKDMYEHFTRHIRTGSASLRTKRKLNEMLEDKMNDEKISNYIPLKSQHIGYITRGNFSFSLGHGFGIGACTVSGLRKLMLIDSEQNRSVKMLVVVRNTTSLKARPAQLEVLA